MQMPMCMNLTPYIQLQASHPVHSSCLVCLHGNVTRCFVIIVGGKAQAQFCFYFCIILILLNVLFSFVVVTGVSHSRLSKFGSQQSLSLAILQSAHFFIVTLQGGAMRVHLYLYDL